MCREKIDRFKQPLNLDLETIILNSNSLILINEFDLKYYVSPHMLYEPKIITSF